MIAGCSEPKQDAQYNANSEPPTGHAAGDAEGYIGSEACGECHAKAFEQWQSSHHAKAMMHAAPHTVAGNFHTASFNDASGNYVFRIDQDRVVVDVEAPEVAPQQFEFSHTFGVEPLQQYLVSFEDGRRQVFGVAAHTGVPAGDVPSWFTIHGQSPPSMNDPLHWQGYLQTWNWMCADCHSTNLVKGYDLASNTYQTTWSEMSVGCEACHGPAQGHVEWAANLETSPHPEHLGFHSDPLGTQREIEVCARCHSRRTQLAEGFKPGDSLYDFYEPSLLTSRLYHPDGQVKDEVFVYGSFLQSRMHGQGVTCSDCHAPHDAGNEPLNNATCTRCHQTSPPTKFSGLAAKPYDHPSHHFHPQGSEAVQCVNCHMPAQVFMGVDVRHDHSFRVPQPLLSAQVGSPDVCLSCHRDETPEWAQNQIEHHQGQPDSSREEFATAFAGDHEQDEAVRGRLIEIAVSKGAHPDIVRATAFSRIRPFEHDQQQMRETLVRTLKLGLEDTSAIVRLGVVSALTHFPAQLHWPMASSMLKDSAKSVRLQAIQLLARSYTSLPQTSQQTLLQAFEEFYQTMQLGLDQPAGNVHLADVLVNLGRMEAAREAYDRALQFDPLWSPALMNLAQLNLQAGTDHASEALYLRAIEGAPGQADPIMGYGLWLVRQGRSDAAVLQFEKAVGLTNGDLQPSYVYALSLNSLGRTQEALAVLLGNVERAPTHGPSLFALATIYRDLGRYQQALEHAEMLVALNPERGDWANLALTLQREVAQTNVEGEP